ncbi:hypothetical protein [Granulicella cerasi]|nr:hypothetical protein [Granulicella cerasi]
MPKSFEDFQQKRLEVDRKQVNSGIAVYMAKNVAIRVVFGAGFLYLLSVMASRRGGSKMDFFQLGIFLAAWLVVSLLSTYRRFRALEKRVAAAR